MCVLETNLSLCSCLHPSTHFPPYANRILRRKLAFHGLKFGITVIPSIVSRITVVPSELFIKLRIFVSVTMFDYAKDFLGKKIFDYTEQNLPKLVFHRPKNCQIPNTVISHPPH